ncbi:MAG: class I SAM-dependent methyltransferase [Paracoccaceae bacterium]
MTPLAEILARQIAVSGPMTMADYMNACLLHPEHGYYATREPFGTKGDFTTAPEISQMFGELIGLWLAQAWMDQGSPPAFTLAEIGPGRGSLMVDVLRATRNVPGFHDAAKLYLIEASARLKAVQRAAFDGDVVWLDTVATLPDAPLFLIANEFFDALPVRQFLRDEGGWREFQIGVEGGHLVSGLSMASPIAMLDHRLADTKTGDIVEVCPAASPVIAELAGRISHFGGAALIVDYGGWHSLGDTLQALKNHQSEGILAHPGQADLTAHVDFEALALAASTVAVSPMTAQGVFLERLGIAARTQALAKNLSGAALKSHVAAHRRLTHTGEMGTLFKTIVLFPTDRPLPAGFSL